MKDYDIPEYFNELLKSERYISAESMKVLKSLIDLTLKFRDKLKAESDRILTVGDTRRAIEIYLAVVKTGYMQHEDDPVIASLVKYWLKEINNASF